MNIPHLLIDNFIPNTALLRAAAESFDLVQPNDWVRYEGGEANQVQLCSPNRSYVPPAALLVLDYIATHFDPNAAFNYMTHSAFPDTSHYGGGMMITPNSKGEGGYLGMHVDAEVHGVNSNWRREYSAVLGVSEEYDSSFDLRLHDGEDHVRVPYKFNRLTVFKCSDNSWHGFPEITKGLDRKTLGVMFWSKMNSEDQNRPKVKAQFNTDLVFK
tara:strand:+ start:41 stop:682 length:642 start_codon:yes stop_codon:yes gene_type:complete